VSSPARVVLGLAPPEEEAIEEVLYGSGELRVLASAADGAELLELAAAFRPDLVLLSAELPGLGAGSLARLGALGPRLAGVALDPHGAAALEALGLDLVVQAPLEAGRLLELLTPQHGPETEPPESSREMPRLPRRREGSVVAFVGARGAPGASELAASFAAHAARSHRVLLVELDADGSRIARRLGVDPHEGSLLGLVRALAAGEDDPAALLPHWIVTGSRGWPAVLPGLPDPTRDLDQTTAPALAERLLETLSAAYPLVVCDLGHRLGRGGGDSAVSLQRDVAVVADALVNVVGSRPDQLDAGLAQLDLLLDELRVAPERLRVVVNGQTGARSPRRAAGAAVLTRALAGRGLTVDAWLPFDARAHRAALRGGLPLALASRRGAYAQGVAELARTILLPDLPRPAARKLRLLPRAAGAPGPALAGEEVALPWRH
jgi:MinD-like ATPase involved in chromosome partitioning or flagellar assembly/CheY-like chemotaxis protein